MNTFCYPKEVDTIVDTIEQNLLYNEEGNFYTTGQVVELQEILNNILLMEYEGHEKLFMDGYFVNLIFGEY